MSSSGGETAAVSAALAAPATPSSDASSSQQPKKPATAAASNARASVSQSSSAVSCSHINVCRPWISWKKGSISEYVSKPRVFFDHLHREIVLFTGSPPNKMWLSDRLTQTWKDFAINLPPHNDIIGAQFSFDRSHVALRVSDKEVKVLATNTGEVSTARSVRGASSRMISVHWIHDPALGAKSAVASAGMSAAAAALASSALFLLFVTNAGVELYELTSERPSGLSNIMSSSSSSSSLTASSSASSSSTAAAPSSSSSSAPQGRLKHLKTAPYPLVFHWILLDENILLLVDAKNCFQAFRVTSKQISKLCKFELDCAGTSLNPPPRSMQPGGPPAVQFNREQISLLWLYGRMVIAFVNEVKGQLHLLSLSSPTQSDSLEQTHVFLLYTPGRYDISTIDNVIVVHNSATRVSMLFDVRSEAKTTITEPLPIGPPTAQGLGIHSALNNNSTMATNISSAANSILVGGGVSASSSREALHVVGVDFFDPAASLFDPSHPSFIAGLHPSALQSRPAPGLLSLAPASFHPYVKWTFLAPMFVWESTGDQQQGNLWTLQMNLQQIAYSWPHGKRTRLVDFLLKRNSVAAKQLILQLLLQIVVTEPQSLALLSRLFALLNRMNYDHRMSPSGGAAGANLANQAPLNLSSLPLLPPFSNPPSAANTAPNSAPSSVPSSNVTSPNIMQVGGSMSMQLGSSGRPVSQSVVSSPYRPPNFGSGVGGVPTSPLAQGHLPSFKASPTHRSTISLGHSQSFSSPAGLAAAAAAQQATGSSDTPPPQRNASAASVSGTTMVSSTSFSISSSSSGASGLHPSSSFNSFSQLAPSPATGISYELDDSLSVLSCEMLDIAALMAQPLTIEHNANGYLLISQLDVFLHVFERARALVPLAQLIPVVVEYLRSIHRHFLRAEDILNDYLVSLLLMEGRHFEFHQYLQYHILNDSLPIANRLIHAAPVYPPAYQLGLDMLYRLGHIPRMVRVLLRQHQVLAALQLIPSYRSPMFDNGLGGGGGGGSGRFTPRDFLAPALDSGDLVTFFQTFRFFEARNTVLRGSAAFHPADGCDEFVQRFQELFAAGGGAGAGQRQGQPNRHYINLGDDDGLDDDEDDDIEYLGELPSSTDEGHSSSATSSPHRSSVSSSVGSPDTTVPASSSSAVSSTIVGGGGNDDDEVLTLPKPLDLSTTVPSVEPESDSSPSQQTLQQEADEDAQAESGLGADVGTRRDSDDSADAASKLQIPDEEASAPVFDAAFGGILAPSNARDGESSKGSSSSNRKGKKGFVAEPAM